MGLYDTITFEHLLDTEEKPFVDMLVRPETGYIEFQTKSFHQPYLGHYHVRDNVLYTVPHSKTVQVKPYAIGNSTFNTRTYPDYDNLIPYLDEQTHLPYHGTVYFYPYKYDAHFAAYFIHGELEKIIQL